MHTNILRADAKRSGPDPSEWIPVTGQGRGTSETQEVLSEFEEKFLYCEGDWALSACSPERWRSFHLWKYSKPTWTQSCANCPEWTRSWTWWSPEGSFQPKQFCDSVNNTGISQNFSFVVWYIFLPPAPPSYCCVWLSLSGRVLQQQHPKGLMWVCFTGGLAWLSKETSLTPWPCDGCCMNDVQS